MLAVISLDAVGAPLVGRLEAEGRLPNLAQLRRSGHDVELVEELAGAAYTTLYTGRGLADHGVYFPLQWSAERQRACPVFGLAAAVLERSSLFRRLAAHGLRVLVLDPPECAPHEVEGGVLASGVQFRARVLLPEWARPNASGRALRRALGRAGRVDEVFGRPQAARLLHARRELTEAPGRLAAGVEHFLGQLEFDFVWVTFAAAHWAGHMLWDPGQVLGLAGDDAARLSGAIVEVYERIDAALGRILARLPPGSDVMVLSPKGMGPNAARVDLLPQMLDRILGQGDPGSRRPASPLWTLRSCVPVGVRAWAASLLPDTWGYTLAGRLETMGRDWKRTRAFAPPCDVHGFVRFNLAGRERRGIVRAAEAAALAEEVEAGLHSFVDMGGASDGAPSVARVERSGDRVGPGERASELPDLLVHWSQCPTQLIRGAYSRRFGEVLRAGAGTGRTGNHCPGTWVTLLPARARLADDIRHPGRLEDVTVTICAALGVPHADLPGRPMLVG
jgi:predicted AlkP superfamily phosphohydrolase/phosphomutase